MATFRWIEPGSSSSDESDADSDGSWVPPPTPPADPNEPELLRLKRRQNVLGITKSNIVPHMDHPGHMPYCIWYPGFAKEDTYRALAHQYPQLRYNVGRACAVGGFLALYLDLDLLPDVTIAEEAREAASINDSQGSAAIFDHIMKQPVRYRVMNDYKRTVNLENPEAGARLNGDTAVRPPLDSVEDEQSSWVWADYFDITEDYPWHLQERDVRENTNLTRAFAYLLHWPLPHDLPTVRKDCLIVMAAYEGNVDRYDRLRRPTMVDDEEEAVIHGIYHSTTFAKYWDLQEAKLHHDHRIDHAITARFIMVNDLSKITEETDPTDIGDPRDYPHLIWEPLIPREETLREIIRRRPNHAYLKEAVALACIAGDFQWTYGQLEVRPTVRLLQQAMKSHYPFYEQDLRRRAAELGLGDELPETKRFTKWYDQEDRDLWPTSTLLLPVEDWGTITGAWACSDPYERWELEANAAVWELYIASNDEMRDRVDKHAETASFGREGIELYRDMMEGWTWLSCLPWKNKQSEQVENAQGSERKEKPADVDG